MLFEKFAHFLDEFFFATVLIAGVLPNNFSFAVEEDGVGNVDDTHGALEVAVLIEVNLGLLAFNLLPIPPLDGFKLIDELLPVKARYSNFYKKFVMYGPTILFVVIIIGSFANIPVFEWLLTIIEMPFRFLLGLAGSGLEMLMSKIG